MILIFTLISLLEITFINIISICKLIFTMI